MEHEAPHTVCAFHTACQVLHPAAAAEFRRLMRERASRGDLRDAAFLWASAVEIQHCPPLDTDVPRVPMSPRASRFVAARPSSAVHEHSLCSL